MSRGQRARTPNNFPRMKYRARKRHQRPAYQFARLGEAINAFGAALRQALERIDWTGLARFTEALRLAAANAHVCDVCQGTGDSNGADWCEECQGAGRILPPESDPDDFDDEDEPELAPPMIVKVAEQHRQDDALRRSADLAIERGHIRASQQ
jgi:hypothetical protein